MNLFVVGWSCSEDERARAAAALSAMHDAFPLLEPTVQTWSRGRGFAGWMLPNDRAMGPRRYVHTTEHELVLFDGTVVDPLGTLAGHDAAELAAHWPELEDRVEGRFVAVRFDARSGTLEVLNDPLGVHQTFVHRQGSTWWISNSARLLARVAETATIDLDGMAQCIGMQCPSGERTLVTGITTMPAAQKWLWEDDAPPRTTTYAPVADLASARKRSFGAREAKELGHAMGTMLEVLSSSFAPLQCPITAGRDSRVLTGLMVSRHLPGDFFTGGEDGSPDVAVGTAIAERFDLPHRRTGGSKEELAASWEDASRRVVQQHDGTVTLMHAKNALRRPDRLESLPVHLYGAAGELGRGKRINERFLVRRRSLAEAVTLAQTMFGGGKGLLRAEAHETVRRHIGASCLALHEQGFAPEDLADAFYLTEYTRRWSGAQARQGVERRDVVTPFLTRPYVHACFATPARERHMERIPYKLIEGLSPALHAMPFESPWPPQRFSALLLRRLLAAPEKLLRRVERRVRRTTPVEAGRKRERLFVLERQLPGWRERYLDRSSSSLWQLIDRERFEFLTSERATQAQRVRHHAALYQVATALAFEADLEDWVGSRQEAPPQPAS
jgi:asparagine synthase (glutamine-hydrolysing)